MQPAKSLLPSGGFDPELLLTPEAAIARYLAVVAAPELVIERVALDAALGRILAESLVADADYPRANRSSMDGFAVASAGTPGRFRIAGEVRMGELWAGSALGSDEAVRIPTGGVLPPGTDAVVPIEDAVVAGERVALPEVPAGDCVSPRGSDMLLGSPALAAGTRLGAQHLGVLATIGAITVPVYRRPRIAVLSSGDELIDPAKVPGAAQVRDSNRYAIAGSLRAMGAEPVHGPIVADVPGALEAALAEALASCDGAMLSGGSSVGAHDYTPDAVAALGAPGVVVHGLKIKPGKPTVFGALGTKPVIGLPGNPLSTLIILEAIVAPLIARLTGATAVSTSLYARLATEIRGREGWTIFAPVTLEEGEGLMAHPLALHSSLVSLAARSAGYAIVRGATLPAGSEVLIRRFLS